MARPATALLIGTALYALAFPPFDSSVTAWMALVPLLISVRGRTTRWAFFYGALYGFACAWGVAGWLAQAIARYFALGLPVGVTVASAYAVTFWSIPFGLFAAGAAILLARPPSLPVRLAIPALWVATELLRGRILAQPWALLGYSQHAHVALIQIAAVTGVYGVSFLVAAVNVGIAEAIIDAPTARPRYASMLLLGLVLVCLAVVGSLGLAVAAGGPLGGFAAHPLAIIQTNVPPEVTWTRSYTDRQIAAHVRATEALPISGKRGLIVWPEHAVPRNLASEPLLARTLDNLAARHRADLIFGAPRYDAGRAYNSVMLVRGDGHEGGHYDKQRLVLVAERSPLARDEAGPDGPRDFSAGEEQAPLRSIVPLGVSVCHEILFPELVARAVASGAALLVNISNDGWLDAGHGVASRQHFAMAVFRAVETRRYLVRAATTGVSGVVDPYGRVIDTLPARTAGVLTTSVAGRSMLTAYVRFGDVFAFACAAAAGFAVYGRRPLPRLRFARAASLASS